MSTQYNKSTGVALIIGSLILSFAMVLHPPGGNFNHLLRVTTLNILIHSLAIFTIPILAFGFLGLKKALDAAISPEPSGLDTMGLSTLAFIFALFALVAAMIAGAINGLVLSLFVQQQAGADPEIISSIRPLLQYNSKFNLAFDYITIAGISLSVCCWSVCIVRTKKMASWLAYLGFALIFFLLMGIFFKFSFVSLFGFRVFVFGLVTWIIGAGIQLVQLNKKQV